MVQVHPGPPFKSLVNMRRSTFSPRLGNFHKIHFAKNLPNLALTESAIVRGVPTRRSRQLPDGALKQQAVEGFAGGRQVFMALNSESTSIDPIRVELEHLVVWFPRGRHLHGKALEIAYTFPRFSNNPRAIIVPDALMSGEDCAWLKRLHFIEGSNPLLALLLIGRL
jgi:hypothetical protein